MTEAAATEPSADAPPRAITARARLLSPLWVTLLPVFLSLLPHVIPDHLLADLLLGIVLLMQIPAALWLLFNLKGRAVGMRLDERGLHAGGHLLEAKEDLRGVWIAAAEPLLFVDGKRLRTFRFETTNEAVVMRDAIGASMPRRTFRLRRSQWYRGLWMGGNRVFYFLFFGIVVVVSLWRLLRMALAALLRPAPKRVDVGPDGLVVVSGNTTHAAPWSRVKRVAYEGSVAHVELIDGGAFAFNVPDESAPALQGAIRDAQRAHAAAGPQTRALARPSGSLASWSRELRGENDAPYREGALSHEALLDIAASPTALPDLRVAAAVAASSALSPEDRARLQASAAASALPGVERTLLRVATGATDEQLEEELAELDRSTRRA